MFYHFDFADSTKQNNKNIPLASIKLGLWRFTLFRKAEEAQVWSNHVTQNYSSYDFFHCFLFSLNVSIPLKNARIEGNGHNNFKIVFIKIPFSSITNRRNPPEEFWGRGVLEICSKFTRELPCRSAISIHLLCYFIEITLWHGCFPVNLLHIFRTPFPKSTAGDLPLN